MPDSPHAGRSVRLGYLVSHPIQYQAPLLRRLAREPDIDLTVLFGSDLSTRGYLDRGFGVEVSWDTPLLEGYRSRFLPPLYDPGTVSALTPLSRSLLGALRTPAGGPAFDALWVHGYASLNSLRGIAAAHALGIPVLLRAESWAGDRPRSAPKLLAKQMFLTALRRAITAVLPIGSHNAAYWRSYLGPSVPQFPVPYAVDNAFFTAKAAAARANLPTLRQSLQLEPGRPVILFASKLQERKRATDLIEAFAVAFPAQPAKPSADAARPYLLIVGDGEQRARLEALCRDRQIQGVRFAGFRNQTELPGFFALADLFVLPSRHEPWGLIVNEAMAAGCPVVVSSEVGAAADLVTHGVEGFVFPAGDVRALAAMLQRAFADPALLPAMAAAAFRRISSWDFEADVRGLRAALAFATRQLSPEPPKPDLLS